MQRNLIQQDRDLVELGFFASALGSDDAIDGTGGNVDTVATNLFQGTWVPLTSKTVIGHDFGAGKDVVAGQFYFESVFDDSLSDPNAYAYAFGSDKESSKTDSK